MVAMSEQQNSQEAVKPKQADAPAAAPAADEPSGPAWESMLESYPTRPEGEDDPRWALNIFWVWAIFVIAAIIFMITLLILGFWFD